MAIIKTVEGKTPQWGKNCFIAENAVLTGDCILGDDCSIWYSAVLRSDVDAITGSLCRTYSSSSSPYMGTL